MVKPVTTRGEPDPVAVKPPGFDVTVYPVAALPPVDSDVLKAILACSLSAVATGLVGVFGFARLAVPPVILVQSVPL